MSFIWSSLLYLLLIVPLLVWIYFRAQRRRRELVARYGNLGVVRDSSTIPVTRRHLPAVVFLIGITILIASIARPQATVSVPRLEGTVILTFDVSGSMAADDLQPTRMEAAKAAAREFAEKQPSNVQIGVVAFSDGGLTVQAPTKERADTLATIDRLEPRRGTSVGNGILVALNTIVIGAGDKPFLSTSNLADPSTLETESTPQGWYPSAVIVLFSDGENNQNPDPAQVADFAVDLGVRIYTVGVGTLDGALIEVEGFLINSRLDEELMKYVATTTGGQYYNATNQDDMSRIYDDLKPKLSIKKENIEVTSLFAGVGMLFFIFAGALSLLWFGRVP